MAAHISKANFPRWAIPDPKKYVMVTVFEDHWDRIPGDRTSFELRHLKDGLTVDALQGETPTLFIRKNRATRAYEQAWVGKVYNIRRKEEKIFFSVAIHASIEAPAEFRKLPIGWYARDFETPAVDSPNPALTLPLFQTLRETLSWEQFEDGIHTLIQLCGVNDLYAVPRSDQRGKADGFFKLRALAVLYDSTLEPSVDPKQTQWQNFVAQMKQNPFPFESRSYNIENCEKQVWIVGRGWASRKIQEIDHVPVKAIGIQDLLNVYYRRLRERWDEKRLEEVLRSLARE